MVATSAVRDAGESPRLLDLIAREAGLQVEIISGEEGCDEPPLGIRSGLPEGVLTCWRWISAGKQECILDRPGQPPLSDPSILVWCA